MQIETNFIVIFNYHWLICWLICEFFANFFVGSVLAAEMNGDIGVHYDAVKRSDVLAIRSLQQIPKSQLHRKLADF